MFCISQVMELNTWYPCTPDMVKPSMFIYYACVYRCNEHELKAETDIARGFFLPFFLRRDTNLQGC